MRFQNGQKDGQKGVWYWLEWHRQDNWFFTAAANIGAFLSLTEISTQPLLKTSASWFVASNPADPTAQYVDANGNLRLLDAQTRMDVKNTSAALYGGSQVAGELTLVALATIIPLGPEDAVLMAAGEGVILALESQLAKKGLGLLFDQVTGKWFAFSRDGKALTANQLRVANQEIAAFSRTLQPTGVLPRAGDDLLDEIRRKGVTIDQSPAAQEILDKAKANGSMGPDGVMRLRPNPARVVALEEYIHHLQWQERARQGLTSGLSRREYILNEIEAAQFALRNADVYKLTEAERDFFRRSISNYQAQLQEYEMSQFRR